VNTGLISKRVYVTERFGKTVGHLWHTHTRIARIGEIYDRENELIIEQESAREVRQVAASGVHQP
jgi:hypothetical protein